MRTPGNNIETTINGLKVSYNDMGPEHGPAIIFIHGFPLDKSMWDGQMTALAGAYRVIAYDVRGHGGSEPGVGDFSIALFEYDLLCLMETLGINRATLCGLSMGGYIALHAVAHHPERFDALILCDTQCIADTREVKDRRIKSMDAILEDGVEAYAEESIGRLFAASSLTTKADAVAAVKAVIAANSSESLCNTLFAIAERRETCSTLLEIGMPSLILVGAEDSITPPDAAALMHLKIRGSLLAQIPDAGHLSNLENPEEFNSHLLSFLERFVPSPVAVGELKASDPVENVERGF